MVITNNEREKNKMNLHPRIKLNMNIMNMTVVMVDGNPGALRVCMELINTDEIGFSDLLHLDDMEIYGSDIWLCYKDICKEDIEELRIKIRSREIKKELVNLKFEWKEKYKW